MVVSAREIEREGVQLVLQGMRCARWRECDGARAPGTYTRFGAVIMIILVGDEFA